MITSLFGLTILHANVQTKLWLNLKSSWSRSHGRGWGGLWGGTLGEELQTHRGNLSPKGWDGATGFPERVYEDALILNTPAISAK